MTQSHTNARASIPIAKVSAALGVINPVTSGRSLVRSITASMSRSTYMLIAFAPPAASEPPIIVANINHSGGIAPSATTIVGIVVTKRSSMIRGLVSAT